MKTDDMIDFPVSPTWRRWYAELGLTPKPRGTTEEQEQWTIREIERRRMSQEPIGA